MAYRDADRIDPRVQIVSAVPTIRPDQLADILDSQVAKQLKKNLNYCLVRYGTGRGVDRSSLEMWRKTITPATAKAIDVLHPFAYRMFGY